MITGFERETHDLTDKEVVMIGPMILALSGHKGKDKAVTSATMITGMKAHGFTLTGARVRKLMNFIRVTKRIKNIVATSSGYYIATTRQEIEDYKKSLDERIASIQALRDSYE